MPIELSLYAGADKLEGNSGITTLIFEIYIAGSFEVGPDEVPPPFTVDYAVTGGYVNSPGADPADANDFSGGVLPSGTLTLQPQYLQYFEIHVAGDTVVEPDETFTITISNPSIAIATIGKARDLFEIKNDDGNNDLGGLFTPNVNEVDFTRLLPAQIEALQQLADRYNALGGDDIITLPNLNTSVPGGYNIAHPFDAGPDDDTVTGGDGNDTIDGSAGNDILVGSAGSDNLRGGFGNDTFDFQPIGVAGLPFGTAQTLDGGENSLLVLENNGLDLIKLSGSPSDYQFVVSFTSNSPAGTRTAIEYWHAPLNAPAFEFDITQIEKAVFDELINNQINLTAGSVAVEMLQLAAEVYGPDNTKHFAEPLAYQGEHDPAKSEDVSLPAQLRGWHPVAAMELGLDPADYGDQYSFVGGGLQYSFVGGHYQAIDPNGISTAFDYAEANALVLSGKIGWDPLESTCRHASLSIL